MVIVKNAITTNKGGIMKTQKLLKLLSETLPVSVEKEKKLIKYNIKELYYKNSLFGNVFIDFFIKDNQAGIMIYQIFSEQNRWIIDVICIHLDKMKNKENINKILEHLK